MCCIRLCVLQITAYLIFASITIMGCGPSAAQRQHEEHAVAIVQCLETFADELESVKDAETAKIAAARMNNTNARLRQLVENQVKLLKISETELADLRKKYAARYAESKKRITTVGPQAQEQCQNEADFLREYEEMRRLAARARF